MECAASGGVCGCVFAGSYAIPAAVPTAPAAEPRAAPQRSQAAWPSAIHCPHCAQNMAVSPVSAPERGEVRELAGGVAAVDRLLGAGDALGEVLRDAAHDQRGGGVEDDDVASRALLALQDGADLGGVLGGRAAR